MKKSRALLPVLSFCFILLISIVAIFAGFISPFPHDYQDSDAILSLPGRTHWLGTDRLGRDLLSRVLTGAQVSISIALVTSLTALIIGTIYGAISGYVGHRLDNLLMRIVDVIYALPDLLLIIMITVVIGRGMLGIFLALSLVSWVTVARLVRGIVLQIKEEVFVEAARALGAGPSRIVTRHILPNALGPIIVTLTFRIPAVILAESTLSFIGLGLTPPFSSWGTLANEGWTAIKAYPHLIIFPSLAIFFTVMAFNILGDWLRDRLHPSLQYR